MTPLCIHHHSPLCGIWTCRWCHSSLWCDLYLWEPSGGLWWYCLLCNAPVPHVCCICSSCFHSNLLHMVESCRVCFGLWCCWHVLFFLVLVLWVPWSCSSPCSGPRWGTYFQSGPFVGVFLLHLVAVGVNIQLWACDVRSLPHCIWL